MYLNTLMLMKNVTRKLLLLLCFFTYVIESHALVNGIVNADVNFEIDQQTISVKGVVMSEFDEPLPGATITIKGTTKGVITDMDGNFTIDAASDAILVVSYIGMEKQEIKEIELVVASSIGADLAMAFLT